MPLSDLQRQRLIELLADEQFDQLTVEDRAELDELRKAADGLPDLDGLIGELTLGLGAREPGPRLPDHLRRALDARGARLIGGQTAAPSIRSPFARRASLLAAACLAIGAGVVAILALQGRNTAVRQAEARIAEMQERITANQSALDAARQRVDSMAAQLAQSATRLDEQQQALVAAASREVDLAQQLAALTSNLDIASIRIAELERPTDPDILRANRQKLLDVPGTVRLAWQPFNLPDAPAELLDVSGDVVWNDELEQGFLRFVGLDPNDPRVEQYQVWVIDERGMEQKVSGGVFNSTDKGEIIVPIHPGIDVRRVAVFAITIEEPGGTWVPDLRRRVVIAPREG